ncbi:MAG: ubiquinone/menaquinone biosynthesis C-methylase UbiE [Bradymonadia bacterium]|jgi:ubiquinone/menaquinone biosynthesis C-methylase UbiE
MKDETAEFFDEMAPYYDRDIVELGWEPLRVVQEWPFVVAAGAEILDAGCGTGAVLGHYSGANRRLAGFDVSPRMVRQALRRRSLKGAELRIASARESWPFESERFDAVVALAMLEFVQEFDVALDEIGRVLKRHGRALVSVEDIVDCGGIEREALERRYDRFNLYRRTREEFEMSLPPSVRLVRMERIPAYTVLERAFRCAYWVAELEKI